MADLLTHVLIGYVLLTVASWRVGIPDRWIAVGMAGTAIPDLVKIRLVVRDELIESLLGVPVDLSPLGTLGGVVLVSGIVALLFVPAHRTAFGYALVGGVLSLIVDGFRKFPDARATEWLFPVTWWHPPSPNLYVSSDLRVLAVAVVCAGLVALLDRTVLATGPPKSA